MLTNFDIVIDVAIATHHSKELTKCKVTQLLLVSLKCGRNISPIEISDFGMALVRAQSSSSLTEQMSLGSHLPIFDRWSRRRLKQPSIRRKTRITHRWCEPLTPLARERGSVYPKCAACKKALSYIGEHVDACLYYICRIVSKKFDGYFERRMLKLYTFHANIEKNTVFDLLN